MANVSRQNITQQKIAEHVQRLGELYPPIQLDSVDRTIKRPWLVAKRFGHVIDYLARVELEVDRNVLELLVLLPEADETNKTFYADVWQPQEIQHGLILDRLQQDLGGSRGATAGAVIRDQDLGGAGSLQTHSRHREVDVLPYRCQHRTASGACL